MGNHNPLPTTMGSHSRLRTTHQHLFLLFLFLVLFSFRLLAFTVNVGSSECTIPWCSKLEWQRRKTSRGYNVTQKHLMWKGHYHSVCDHETLVRMKRTAGLSMVLLFMKAWRQAVRRVTSVLINGEGARKQRHRVEVIQTHTHIHTHTPQSADSVPAQVTNKLAVAGKWPSMCSIPNLNGRQCMLCMCPPFSCLVTYAWQT